MFVIKNVFEQDRLSNYYFNKKGKILLFNTPDEALAFLDEFKSYAIDRKLAEGQDFLGASHEILRVLSSFRVIEQDFKDIPSCGVTTLYE